MVAVHINGDTCSGYGNCVLASSKSFDTDDEDLVVLPKEDVSPDEAGSVRLSSESITVIAD
ncbi:ferredoxin [Streptomyces sp. NPDC005336]|uniref:ferredoxin n=1 Tax=Streptomyces sp. NPDC005336 TaxID=3157035 RepID=UPI0033B8934D